MIELRLRYQGEGRFIPASRLDYEMAEGKIERGSSVIAKITKPRSIRQNNYFHALIEYAFENQRAGPHLPTWRHLKSWLLIRADWCTVQEFDPGSMSKEMAAWLRRQFDTVDVTTNGEKIFVKVARSVSFSRADADTFAPVMDKVIALICSEIVPGMKPEDLVAEAKRTLSSAPSP
jgi:hypothetical protein